MFPVSMPSFFRKAIVVSTQMHCLHLLQRATWLMPQHDHCPFRPTSTFILILHLLLVAPTHWQTLRRIHMGLLQWGFWLKDSRRPHQILWELCCSQWFHFIPLACFSPNTLSNLYHDLKLALTFCYFFLRFISCMLSNPLLASASLWTSTIARGTKSEQRKQWQSGYLIVSHQPSTLRERWVTEMPWHKAQLLKISLWVMICLSGIMVQTFKIGLCWLVTAILYWYWHPTENGTLRSIINS